MAIEANELLPSVSTAELLPSVSIWTILGGLITAGAITIATIMATVIQYKVVVKGNAIVRPAAVIDIFTKIDQPVKKGDIIATLDDSQLQTQKIQFKKTNIVATANGIIAKLNLRNPGQTVKAGEEIAQIVPSNSAMEIKAQISPQDISKVRLEQPVDMRISACPYPDYGTLSGIVNKISPDAFTAHSNNNKLPFISSTKAVYEVTIVPDSLVLSQGSKQCSLQLGMEGRADIISNQETVWQFILRKARLTTNL